MAAIQRVFHQFFPAAWQVVGDAADAVPGWVQTETGDGFDHRVRLLAVGEGEEYRSHGADVLDVGTEEQQVAGDPEELGHHDADDVDLLWHLDAGQLSTESTYGRLFITPPR